MSNQKGGIIFKLLIVPVGAALMVGFFSLGYYLGKYQNKSEVSGEIAPPLPEIVSRTGQKLEEFTFYKTLTDKNDKTVSIDLKPKTVIQEVKTEKQQTNAEAPKTIPVTSAPKEKRIAINPGKEAISSARSKQAESRQPQQPAQKERVASTGAKHHYTVQTASYPDRGMAEDEVKRLKKRGFAAFIVSSELPGKGMWHRVRLGSFSNRGAAEKLQKAIHEKERILTIVVSD